MSSRNSYKCNYHKKRRDFHLISEIRQWIIDFWCNFIKRLKNVLSERRLSRIQSLHTKSITSISTHYNPHNINEAKNINQTLAVSKTKSPVKLKKKSRKHKKKIEKIDEIFEELSDDYLALYRKKSYCYSTPKQSNSMMINKKQSSYSTKSRCGSRQSQLNVMVQEVTQKFIDDGIVDDLNWIPKVFGCILPSASTSRLSLHKIDDYSIDKINQTTDDTSKLEKIKTKNHKYSKIPRYQYQNSTVIRPQPKIPYSKHHKKCINNN